MRIGLGDTNADLNALYSTQLATSDALENAAVEPAVYANSPAIMTGAPLLLGSSTVSQAVNQLSSGLSSNSGLIVAGCAILGLIVAMGKK